MMSGEHAVQRARCLLSGWGVSAATNTAPITLDEPEAASLLLWAESQGIDGVLWAAIDEGAVALDAGSAQRARDTHVLRQHHSLAAELGAAEATDKLNTVGIAAWLLKGLAAAHLDYPDPALRTSNDADLLVARGDLPLAVAVLEGHGYVRTELAMSRRWERRFARAVVLRSPLGVELDLHAAVAAGYFGVRLDHPALLALGHEPIDLGGVKARGLAGPARLLSSCYMAVLSRGPNVRLQRDIAQQLIVTHCDWRAAAALAHAGDGEAVMATALIDAAAETGFDATHPALEWARGVTPSSRALHAMTLVELGHLKGWSADARSMLLALRPVDRTRFMYGVGIQSLRSR